MWNCPENQIKLVLIRHGATKANKEHRYLGKTDETLSVEGIRELQERKCEGSYPEIDYLFSSPMKRCLETAGILYPDKKTIVIPDWEEMDFGAFEGKNYLDLQGDERYQEWIRSNGTLPLPEGESREAFIKRCELGLYKMFTQFEKLFQQGCNHDRRSEIGSVCLHGGGGSKVDCDRSFCNIRIGLLIHGGTIMALLSRFYGGEYFDYQIANGKGYICKIDCSDEKIRFDALEKI